MGEPKADYLMIHGHRINRVGTLYFPSGFKNTSKAPWWIEKMFGREVWILYRPGKVASVYYLNMKQALLDATRP